MYMCMSRKDFSLSLASILVKVYMILSCLEMYLVFDLSLPLLLAPSLLLFPSLSFLPCPSSLSVREDARQQSVL